MTETGSEKTTLSAHVPGNSHVVIDARTFAAMQAVVEAAQEYRAVSLDDPLSLDRPVLGAKLDKALLSLHSQASDEGKA